MSQADVDGAVDAVTQQDIRDLHGLIKQLRQDLSEVQDRLDALEQDGTDRDDEIASLKGDIQELDNRTDLLQLLEEDDDIDGERMQVALIQHLHEKAQHRHSNLGKRPVAAVDHEDAMSALQYPDVERTTVYTWMKRAADRIEGSVLQYQDGRLKLNLTAGDLPKEVVSR